jgi:hypothetical protein
LFGKNGFFAMMSRHSSILIVSLLFCGCRSPYFVDRGAGLGAITGALAGAAIGEHNGDALTGALVGSAVGGIAGAAVGNAVDENIARNQALVEERLGRQMAGAVTVDDVIQMSRAGLSENVIITHIQTHGVAQKLQVPDLIHLRNNQVSDVIITSYQNPPVPQAAVPVAAPAPVIVEQHYISRPPPPPLFFHMHHHPHRGRSHVGWGVTFN